MYAKFAHMVVWAALCALAIAQAPPETKGVRVVGAVKAVANGSLSITSDSGETVTANVQPQTKIVRVAPGQKDLKEAVPVSLTDLQVGDRVLMRGLPGASGQPMTAAIIIVMKQADVASKHEQESEDWQKRGVGGLVTSVDASAGTITISLGPGSNGSPAKTLLIRTTPNTLLRRYAAGSIKFEDAKPAPLVELRPGDQLRAKGNKNSEGTELSADEVISGSFRNIAGTVLAKDEATSTITVQDLLTKKPVQIKLAADSTMKNLPAEIAQRIAMRLKGAGNGAGAGNRPSGYGGGAGAAGGGGAPDLQRFLSRLPNKQLGELNKGDAVMIVATESAEGKLVTAITLLAGVEPILTAAPNGALSSWSLGSSLGEGGPQ